jgi:hypothetical protein
MEKGVNMKWPLIVAAALVVGRIVIEQLGAPEMVNNIFGVAWLYFLVPIYFARQIAVSGDPKPFKSLIKSTALYAAYTRLMVLPTYWLAYVFNWTAPRFSSAQGGVVAADGAEPVTPLMAYLIIPVRNALVWILFATIVGGLVGWITFAILRRGVAAKSHA